MGETDQESQVRKKQVSQAKNNGDMSDIFGMNHGRNSYIIEMIKIGGVYDNQKAISVARLHRSSLGFLEGDTAKYMVNVYTRGVESDDVGVDRFIALMDRAKKTLEVYEPKDKIVIIASEEGTL